MKDIGYKDVETYVRTMIFEGFGSKAEDNKDGATKRNKRAHTEPSSAPIQAKANQKEKRSKSKNEC